MKRIVAGFAIGGFAVVAIAMAPPAAAGPEADFLDALASGGLSFPPRATSGVISAGHKVCGNISKGDSIEDAIAEAADGLGGNRTLAKVFVNAATSTLCPD